MTSPARRMSGRRLALIGATCLTTSFIGLAAHAQTAPAAAPAADTVEEVVVTGFRASLANSTNAKRESVGFSDTVFAEDIGKFPDLNIAESLNRMPGVQLTREINGEGLNVAIRGLGTNFTKVLLNGAQAAVASSGRTDSQNQNREVDLDLYPTELFTRLDVSKTPTAGQVEGGVAGVVNMRSARPFDYKSSGQLIYSIQAGKNNQADDISPRGSLIASKTWETPVGEFGILGGAAFARNKSTTEGFETIGWTNPNMTCTGCNVTGGNGFNWAATVPAGVTSNGLTPGQTVDNALLLALNPGTSLVQLSDAQVPRLGRDSWSSGSRNRDSFLVSLEWRPNDDLNFYLDTMYSKAERKFERIDMNWSVRNSNFMVPVGVKVDSNGVATEGTFLNSQFFLEYRPYDENVEVLNLNPGFSWRPNDWIKVDGQVNWSRSVFFREAPTVLFNSPLNSGLNVTYKNNGGDRPTITPSKSLNDPNLGWVWAGGRVNVQNEKRVTATKGAHFDVTFGEDKAVNFKVGAAYDDVSRAITAIDNSGRWQTFTCGGGGVTPQSPAPSPVPGCDGRAGSAVPQASLSSYIKAGPIGFVTLDKDKFFAATNYDAFNAAAPFSSSAATGAASGFIGEKTTGAYIEMNGITQILDRDLKFNAGVRYYSTDQTIQGPQTVNGVLSFLDRTTNYDGMLPSLNAAWNLRDNVILRMSASRTMTRPNPSAMLPGTTFSDPSAQQANQGNPNLQPYLSNNFDIGGEWYTGGAGYVGVALFRKELTGFTVNGTNTIPFLSLGVPYDQLTNLQQQAITNRGGPNTATVTVSQQVNADGVLTILGQEVTWVQPLDFVLKGSGFTANATHVEQNPRGTGAPAQAVGVSPWSYNVTGYYEDHGATVRLSYVWNDAQVSSGNNQNGIPFATLNTDARGQWDLSASYEFKGLPTSPRVTLDVINITEEPQRSTFAWDNAAFTFYQPGRQIIFGIRGKF
jgi:TonB-dependent receptor